MTKKLKVEKYVIGEEETDITHGSGNVFADLELDDAIARLEERHVKPTHPDLAIVLKAARLYAQSQKQVSPQASGEKATLNIAAMNQHGEPVDAQERGVLLPTQADSDGWQTIESAPRDGTEIFVKGGTWNTAYSQMHGFDVGEYPQKVRYKKKINEDIDPPWTFIPDDGDYSEGLDIKNPTHWMPLPAAPQFDEDKSKHDLSKGE